jgi:hypothetical protein
VVELTGSLNITGSSTIVGDLIVTLGGITGSILATNGVLSGSAQIGELTQIAGIEAYTASLKAAAIVSSSTQIENYFLFAETASANTFYGNQTITGSLNVRDGITGSFLGNVNGALNGVASLASQVAVVSTNTLTDTTLYPMFSATPTPNTYITPVTHQSGSFFFNGVSRRLHMEGFVVSGSNNIAEISGSLIVTGSIFISGSVYANTTSQSVASNTASLDFTAANFFMVQLGSNVTTHISASNLRAGQSVNVLVTTGTNSTASFSTNVRQPSGSFYLPTSGSGNKDVLSFVSFDSSNLYLVAVNQMI